MEIGEENGEMNVKRTSFTRSFWLSASLFVVFNCAFLLWVLFKPGTTYVFVIGDDVGQALGWLLGTLLCFIGVKKLWQHIPGASTDRSFALLAQRWVPIFLAAGIFCQFIGQVIYTYYDMHHWPPFPSWADIAYLSTFPFLMVGILLLPTQRLSGMARTRFMLDSILIMTAIVTFSWYFVLGPTMLQGYESNFALVIGSAYPFFDLVLISCVLRLSFHSIDAELVPVVRLLSVGLVIIVITDSIYDYQTLQNIYVNGWQDLGWPVGYMLIGLAAQAFNSIRSRSKTVASIELQQESSPGDVIPVASDWQALRPYILIPAVILLIAYVWWTGANSALEQGVYWGGAVLVVIILLRQLFAIRETFFYNRKLQSVQNELHRKNQELSDANTQLETQAVQIASAYEEQRHLNDLKDQFLLNVNHELRTPLTEINGYLSLLSEYHGQLNEETQATFLSHAVHGCEELLHLVNNVLEAIRGDVNEKATLLESLSVDRVVREVLDLFEPQKRQQHNLKIAIPEQFTVCADRQYLHRILLNLLSNAFKYSPDGATITLSAQVVQNAAEASEGMLEQICISVQDAGQGIPQEEIPVLFGKFVRLKRDMLGTVRGTGLGLYISKQLVEAMGGHIWVESAGIPGLGSRFCFTLPTASYTSIAERTRSPIPLAHSDNGIVHDGDEYKRIFILPETPLRVEE